MRATSACGASWGPHWPWLWTNLVQLLSMYLPRERLRPVTQRAPWPSAAKQQQPRHGAQISNQGTGGVDHA
jgi:hypothetical protein